MKHVSLIAVAFGLLLGACERHSWESVGDENGNGKIDPHEKGTKELYDHGDYGDGHGKDGDHGKGHGKDGDKKEDH